MPKHSIKSPLPVFKYLETCETAELNLVDEKLGFTSPYLHNEVLINAEDPTIATMLLITAGALPTSAKYDTSEETPDLYKNISVIMNDKTTQLELTYDTDKVNRKQIMVYVSEYVMFNTIHSLPASTTTALETFVAPFITKYTSNASQLTIIGNVLGKIEYKNNMIPEIHIEDYNYPLPDERIAKYPLSERDASKLLVLKSVKANF